MCRILMSINPKYVDEILAGRKKYEYRRIKAKKKNVDKIIVYCTSPIKKVVAEIDVVGVIADKPDDLWNNTKNYAGISKVKYDEYFKNKDIAVAYKLGSVLKYDIPKDLDEFGIKFTPQSFIYID